MALINCSECNNQISSNASSCPFCGNPIKVVNNAPKIIVKKGEGLFSKTLNAGCLVILLIIGFFVLSAIFSSLFFKDYAKKLDKQRTEKSK